MAALFRDMLRFTPETEAEVRQQIQTLLPFGFGAPRNEIRTVLDQILMTEDPETRRRLIEPQLKFGRADRDLAADAAAGSFAPGSRLTIGARLGITRGGKPGPGRPRGQDGDPESEPKDATNPRTRLPRTNGRWEGEPGNGDWFSDHPEVLKVTKGKPIRYIDGRPDFSPWAAGDPMVFEPGVLDGSRADFGKIYARLAKELGLKSRAAARRYLSEKELTPHHLDDLTILLVPSALNNNLPHIGSASDMRRKAPHGSRRK